MPNSPDRAEFRARYLVQSSVALERVAEIIAGEQSSGTFVALPGETDELRRRAAARVTAVEPLDDAPHASLASAPAQRRGQHGPFHRGHIEIAFPLASIGGSLTTLLATVAGNLFELGEVTGLRLLDLDLPSEFAANFAGPRFGIEGTRQVARAAARAGVPRIAFFSGLGVARYGMARRTTNPYFLSKLAAELALFQSGLAVSVFRPSYVVGPGDALVRGLLREMAAGVVERPGDGRYRMQPVAVADAAAAILAAAGAAADGDPRVCDLVGPEPITFDAFVARLAARAGARGLPATYSIIAVPETEADRQARQGGYRGLQPDELDCMLCDEVADPAPLSALLGRPLLPLDAALDAALAGTAPSINGGG